MASGSIASGVQAYSSTLVASTADTVTFADRYGYVSVTNTGTGVIYVTADNSAPATSGSDNSIAVNAGTTVVVANGLPLWFQSAKVITQGAVAYPTGGGVTSSTANGQPGEVQPFMSSLAGKSYANPGTIIKLLSTGTPTYTVAAAG